MYRYRVIHPELPSGSKSVRMSDRDVENWLNKMSEKGWDFVGCGVHFWSDGLHQQHWIFRKENTLSVNEDTEGKLRAIRV